MNRLTKRNGINYIARNKYCDYDAVLTDIQLEAAYQQCVDKLGQLEDIEEELGIDLITLFKVLKNGFYTIFYNKHKYDNSCYYTIDLEFKCIWVNDYDAYFSLDFKDYGKTWALTKEELENDKRNDTTR